MSQDLADFLRTYDILALIEHDVQLDRKTASGKNGPEYAGPCPWCGGDDRFIVWPQHSGGRGRFWCRKCQKIGDAIAYLQNQGFSLEEAQREIGYTPGDALASAPARPQARKPRPRSAPKVQPPSEVWQARARRLVEYAQEQLWSAAGMAALDYLHERGLRDETILRFKLGFNPGDLYDKREKWGIETGKKVYLPLGVAIPCEAAGAIWYIQIRRPAIKKDGSWDRLAEILGGPVKYQPEKKYWSVKDGAGKALYGADLFSGGAPLLFCEGEFDAMIAWQEIGGGSERPLADVTAIGGCAKVRGGLPEPWRGQIAGYERLLVAFDADGPGQSGALDLLENDARVRYARIIQGNDITDFYLTGGDLRAWFLFFSED